jgi:hypothetical protein
MQARRAGYAQPPVARIHRQHHFVRSAGPKPRARTPPNARSRSRHAGVRRSWRHLFRDSN